jgi:hypothetical protein
VQVLSHIRSNQNIRVGKRAQHVADYFATHPGTPHRIRIRGGAAVSAMVGSARLYVCSHKTKRFIVAIKYEGSSPRLRPSAKARHTRRGYAFAYYVHFATRTPSSESA